MFPSQLKKGRCQRSYHLQILPPLSLQKLTFPLCVRLILSLRVNESCWLGEYGAYETSQKTLGTQKNGDLLTKVEFTIPRFFSRIVLLLFKMCYWNCTATSFVNMLFRILYWCCSSFQRHISQFKVQDGHPSVLVFTTTHITHGLQKWGRLLVATQSWLENKHRNCIWEKGFWLNVACLLVVYLFFFSIEDIREHLCNHFSTFENNPETTIKHPEH